MKPLNSDRCGDLRTLLPLFLLIGSLPVLSHWLKAQLPSFLDPDPASTCSIGGGGSGCASGKCPLPKEFEELASNTNLFKVGYVEFNNPPTLPVREKPAYYLNRKQELTATYDSEDYNAWHGAGWFCFGYYGNEAEDHASYSYIRTDVTAPITETVTTSFGG